MHNFSVPSTPKLWIDQVVRTGKTFAYTATGAEGLLKSKKATLLMASGGVYEQGSAWEAFNFVTPYLRTIFGFMGITDVHFIAEGGAKELIRKLAWHLCLRKCMRRQVAEKHESTHRRVR
jgi:FMN-dependent NADH-azoreductase